jgi:hypothetical protein
MAKKMRSGWQARDASSIEYARNDAGNLGRRLEWRKRRLHAKEQPFFPDRWARILQIRE